MLTIRKFLRDESGATAIEYGLIAAGISVAIIATVTTLGGKLVTTFGKTYLLASPITQNAQFGKHDAGCAVFQVTNLSNAAILRTPNGAPQMIKYVQGPANTPRGACTYTPHDTGSGINFAEISPGSSPPIQIVESLVQLP